MKTSSPLGLLGTLHAASGEPGSGEAELAHRLRADLSGQLRRELLAQLDGMLVKLRTQAGRGVDSSTWDKIEAGLAAVAAARDILTRMPVAESSVPAGLPASSFRSTP